MLGRVVGRAAGAVLGTEPLRVFIELGRHPRLFRVWLPFSSTMLYGGLLPRADTELVILRTAWQARCRYEWVQHAGLAGRRGLDEVAVAATAEGPRAAAWTPRQRLLIEAVDGLHGDRGLGPDAVGDLREVLDARQLIELCMLVGAYEMLAMTLNTLEVQPEPQALAALPPALRAVAAQLP